MTVTNGHKGRLPVVVGITGASGAAMAVATIDRLLAMDLPVDSHGAGRQSGPYNLLVTRSWMLLVPRSRDSFRGVPVNALGFAGSLLVRNRRELQLVREIGPMTILREVGIATT